MESLPTLRNEKKPETILGPHSRIDGGYRPTSTRATLTSARKP